MLSFADGGCFGGKLPVTVMFKVREFILESCIGLSLLLEIIGDRRCTVNTPIGINL